MKKRVELLLAAALCALLAIALELAAVTPYDLLRRRWQGRTLRPAALSLEQAALVNCALSDGKLISGGDDAQAVFSAVDRHVGDIALRLHEGVGHRWKFQVYYDTPETPFTEAMSAATEVAAEQTEIVLTLDRTVKNLRLDLGNAPREVFSVASIVVNPPPEPFFSLIARRVSGVRIGLFFFAALFLTLCCRCKWAFGAWLFRHRCAAALALLAFCVACKLHGSSLGCLYQFGFLDGEDVSRLFGRPRAIRTDEWAAFTQMALSQVKAGFPWFSNVWGYSPSDMFLIYGQPVADWATVFRPFSLAYFFGAEHGLSFFWCGRLIALFFVSFEFARLFTRDDRRLSLVWACAVSLAPVVQWWFAVNGLLEMLIFGQLALLLLRFYLETANYWARGAVMLGLVWCSGCYALTLYPAWAVPLFYAFAACAVALLSERIKTARFGLRDIVLAGAGACLLAFCLFHVWSLSHGTIEAVLSTAYPGQRRIYGGDLNCWKELFRGWHSLWWTALSHNNPCELVSFVDFFPLGLILSLALFARRKWDAWLALLNGASVLIGCDLLGLCPRVVSEWGLLTLSAPGRAVIVFNLLNLLILLRALCLMKDAPLPPLAIGYALTATAVGVYCSRPADAPTVERFLPLLLIPLAFYAVLSCPKRRGKALFTALCVVLALLGGAYVNPVNSGLKSVYGNQVVKDIAAADARERGLWCVAVPEIFVYNNLPAVVGAKTLNALATYPDRAMWKTLGLEAQAELWNRYAHISVRIAAEGDTGLELLHADALKLHLTPAALRKLGVRYILTSQDLSALPGFEKLRQYRVLSIYRLNGSVNSNG